MKKSTLERKIAALRARLQRIDERICFLMTERADIEDELAELLGARESTCDEATW